MDKSRYIRVWLEMDLDMVKNHLLLIDDLYGTCANCKQLGLNYLKDKSCPGCKNEFKYLATNMKNASETGKILQRIKKENLSFQLIDREDYNKASAQDAVKDLFK